MEDMKDIYKGICNFLRQHRKFVLGMVAGAFALAVIYTSTQEKPEYRLIEDNAIETAISIEQGNNLTLINVNRYEDGGGLWVTTYDGKGVPESVKIESTKETEND